MPRGTRAKVASRGLGQDYALKCKERFRFLGLERGRILRVQEQPHLWRSELSEQERRPKAIREPAWKLPSH